jgi:predicted RNase H-like HicB family nuclease
VSQLIVQIPETLHRQLESLARSEGVSLSQYIVFTLTRQGTQGYTVHAVPGKEIAKQRRTFAELLQNLGQASFAEIEQVMQEREVVTPGKGLTPEVVKRLQNRIANQQPSGADLGSGQVN